MSNLKTVYIFLLFWGLTFGCGSEEDGIKARVGTITESVYASVTLQPDSMYDANAPISGIVDEVFVKEGDEINKGDALVKIKNEAPELSKQNAQLALELARSNYSGQSTVLQGLDQQLEIAKINLKLDSTNYKRQRRLWNQGIGTALELDNRKKAYEVSSKTYLNLLNEYERTKNELLTKLRQAQNDYKKAQVAENDFIIQSRLKGKVYDVLKEPGELVGPQEPVATVGLSDQFIIEMLVDEVDIAAVGIGQKALITLDAYPGEVFNAQVTRIYPRKNERTQTFLVESMFSQAPEVLYPGLSGEANILIQQTENALILPKRYVANGQVKTDDGFVAVETGLESMEDIQVVSGIDSATLIYLPE